MKGENDMRTIRIELVGKNGCATIERRTERSRIRIDSFLNDPKRGQTAWKIWEFPANIGDEKLFKYAVKVQRRCDGCIGTYLAVLEYFVEMQRFQA